MVFLFLTAGGNIRPHRFIVQAEILAELWIQSRPFHVELCLQGSRLRIIAGMDDGGVGHRRPVGDIIFFFNDCNAQMTGGKIPGKHSAGNPRPDNHNIIHIMKYLSFFTLL